MSRALASQPRRRRGPRPQRAGLTLFELMVVLIIIGILGALSLPSVLQSMINRRVHAAALDVSQVFKSQRYRAQNLNRAVGIEVTSAGQVLTYISADNTCTNVGSGTATAAVDIVATSSEDAKVNTTAFTDQVVCIRPDGSVVDPANGQPFVNGPVTILVGRADGIGNSHTIIVPYNGIARLD